jgi:hypothetical protein
MKWQEVRELFPNQFVLLEELKSHVENNQLYVEEVALIRPVPDDQTLKELRDCKGERFIYHTANDQIILEVRTKPAIRRN